MRSRLERKGKDPKIIEGEIIEEWDKKKVGILAALFLLIIAGGLYFLKSSHIISMHSILGASTTTKPTQAVDANPPQIPKVDLQQKIDQLKGEANNIDLSQIATSSPQVKKLLHDLQALQTVPHDQVRSACENICKSL